MPAIPLHTAGKYVAAAYIVVFAIVLIYVAIMALRLARIERDLGELVTLARERELGSLGMADPDGGVQEDAAPKAPLEVEPAHP